MFKLASETQNKNLFDFISILVKISVISEGNL